MALLRELVVGELDTTYRAIGLLPFHRRGT
jgi:hypothetical protein